MRSRVNKLTVSKTPGSKVPADVAYGGHKSASGGQDQLNSRVVRVSEMSLSLLQQVAGLHCFLCLFILNFSFPSLVF